MWISQTRAVFPKSIVETIGGKCSTINFDQSKSAKFDAKCFNLADFNRMCANAENKSSFEFHIFSLLSRRHK